MADFRSPHVRAALHLVDRMRASLDGKMKPGSAAHSTFTHAARLAASVDSLEELARNRSPSETPEAHTLRVANAAKKLDANLKQVISAFNENTMQTYRNLYTKLSEVAQIDKETPHAAEIRAYFRGLKQNEKIDAIDRAIKTKDSATLAALVNGPDYLSGVDKAMRDNMMQRYHEEVAPELVAEIRAFEEADSAAQEVRRITEKAVTQAFDPSYVASILEAEAKAQATRDRLDASMTALSAPPPETV